MPSVGRFNSFLKHLLDFHSELVTEWNVIKTMVAGLEMSQDSGATRVCCLKREKKT